MKPIIIVLLIMITVLHGMISQSVPQFHDGFTDPHRKISDSKQCTMSLLAGDIQVYRDNVNMERRHFTPRDGTYNIPVQFHLLRRTNGTGGITFENAAQELEWANDIYSVMGIEFFQCSTPNEILDDALFNTEFDHDWDNFCGQTTAEYEIAGDNNVDDVINIYYVNTDGWNWSCFPYQRVADCKDWIIMHIGDIGNSTLLAHELGHYFNLLHTHQGYGNGIAGDEEAIVRNEDDDCFNCEEYGDMLCDTHADNNHWSNCQWDGTGTDGCSTLSFQPDDDNIMSYSGCTTYFTTGQHNRIVYNVLTSREYLNCPFLSDCIPNRNVTGSQNGMYAYQASNSVTSVAEINAGAVSVYDAGSFIQLMPGFHAKAGATFNAILDGCWNPVIYPD